MKTSKKAKALLSFALVITMLFSMCIVGFTGVSAAGLDLNYEFAYKNAGYAEGRLSLSGTSGTYILYWADDTKAIEGYSGIAQMTISSSTKYFEMPANTAIPAGATKVIAVKSGDAATVANASAVFDIPADKQFKAKPSEKIYDFMALSDIHIDYGNWYTYAKEHLANSLEVAANRDVDFITTCGDNMNGNSGTANYAAEWKTYQKILASSNYNNPIYETNGNHETYNDGGDITDDIPYTFGLETYKDATGLNVKTEKMQEETYYEKTINGDHYIFMVLELSKDPGKSNEFTDKQLKWLEDLLDKYEGDGHRVFINEHALFRGYGAGDNKATPYYGAGLVDTYPQVKRLKGILEAHKDVIFFSGHTHIDFKYGYNFDNENGKTAYTVHIPSNASTTHPNASGGLDYIHDTNSSQGYLVDVYDDYVILNGTELAYNLIYPAYTYLVDYTGEELVENEMDEIVYDTVTVTVDVSNLTDAPTEVICVAIDESNAANNQQIPMTRNADGTYSAKVISEYSSVYFAINGATGVKTSAFPVDNCKITLGYQTLNYTPSNSVSFVRAHVWGDGGDGTTWPGTTMTNSGNSYTVKIPASDYTGVVFNWGDGDSNKTTDLAIADYITDRVDDVYVSLDGEVTEPTETTEPSTAKPTTAVKTEPTEAPTTAVKTEPTEAPTTAPKTEPTETTTVTEPTEPAVDELAPIVIVEYKDDCFLVDAYPADSAEDVEFKFAVSGRVVQDYSENSKFIFGVGGDGMYILEVTAKYADGSEHMATVMIEVKDGVVILPEMPERPTAPDTEPTETSTPDETVPTTADTVPTTETTAPAVEYLYGDADLNGKINVKDATQIQKYAAKMLTLDETAMVQADVTGDMKVNVKDATSVQKYIAKIISVFPVEEGAAPLAAVGATALQTEVKGVLSKEYQYASYDAYMALKKAYMNNVSDTDLNKAYTDYKTMKGNNPLSNPGGTANIGDIDIGQTGTGTPTIPGPSIGGGSSSGGSTGGSTGGNTGGTTTETVKVYFTDSQKWGNAYIYGFYGEVGVTAESVWPADYPGAAMTYVETDDSGNKVYSADVPADIDYIKFSDNSATNNRTDNIPNAEFENGTLFTITTKGDKYWGYNTSAYTGNNGGNSGNNGGNTGGTTTDTVKIHFKPDSSWAGAYIYGFYGEVGGTATGEPLGGYPGKAMTSEGSGWYVADVPADIDYIKFTDGTGSDSTNDRTDNIPNSLIGDGVTFTITTKGSKYWEYTTGSAVTPPDGNTEPNPSTGTASTYYLRGTFTDWDPGKVMTLNSDGSASITLSLSAGEYKFKVYDTASSTWYGNGGTIEDTETGWTFTTSGGDCTLNATGGTYIFKCYTNSEGKFKVDVTK